MKGKKEDCIFAKDCWIGDSRDGSLINGEGYHFFKLSKPSRIIQAYEFYETEDGQEIVTHVPEMENVDWIKDLGFETLEALELISERDYQRIQSLCQENSLQNAS